MKLFNNVLLLASALFFSSCEQKVKKDEFNRPNIIVILTDDQGWGDLSFNGNTNLNTPNIDSIAFQGAVMENFFVQPVCSPTRAELLTGQYFSRLGVYATSEGGERMNLGVPTIAEIFKKSGYKTAAYGKWHNGTQPPYHPNSRGFDDFYGFCSGHWGNYFSPMLEYNGIITKGNGFLVDDLFNHGIEFISQNKESPFLVYLPINTPHSPMQSPDKYWNRFKDKELDLKYGGKEYEDEQFTKAALAMVENVDWNVGRLNRHLKRLGLEENTIVIYMSDNGPNGWRWNGGLRGKKGSTDEGGVKSPFFMKWPKKITSGLRSAQIMGTVDLLPTLASLAQVPLSDTLDLNGVDLSINLLSKKEEIKDRTIYNHWNGKTSIRTQKYRLDQENRLYDMVSDLGQKNDISKNNLAIKDSLITLKKIWEEEVNVSFRPKTKRLFPIGASGYNFTQLPARDGIAHGNIKRSNRWPNDSFYVNWTSKNDSITWDVNVLESGTFEVFLYYTCKAEDLGTELELKFKDSKIIKKITEAHNPPLIGAEKDRFPRMESYVKDFKAIKMGEIYLDKGIGQLNLKAITMLGSGVIDFRLLNFKRK
ncbi:arylsulfatase [Croceitalea rosinachiae]|uniref:Arylsulfatase n=1 Tax=Croceitalea rosinachiae TaxID=3075596 RepID=A0ABU3ADB0_9FLAO|nr:arylsulfatase [Croceitalea sp. F388]MDT0607875.1 arylsulfatase [Croceitalea sp. F388]